MSKSVLSCERFIGSGALTTDNWLVPPGLRVIT